MPTHAVSFLSVGWWSAVANWYITIYRQSSLSLVWWYFSDSFAKRKHTSIFFSQQARRSRGRVGGFGSSAICPLHPSHENGVAISLYGWIDLSPRLIIDFLSAQHNIHFRNRALGTIVLSCQWMCVIRSLSSVSVPANTPRITFVVALNDRHRPRRQRNVSLVRSDCEWGREPSLNNLLLLCGTISGQGAPCAVD